MAHNKTDALCCGVSSWMNCNERSKALRYKRLLEAKEAGDIIDAKSRIFEKKTVDHAPILTEYKNIVYKEGKPVLEFTTSYGDDVWGSNISNIKYPK